MKVLIVFNHPAPYKVRQFNVLAKYIDLTVIFERNKAKNRPDSFYNINDYEFNTIILKKGYIGNENTFSKELYSYIKNNYRKYSHIIMNGYSTIAERKAIRFLNKNKIPFILMINGGVIKKETKIRYWYKKKYISSASQYFSPNEEANKYLLHYGARKEDIFLYPYSSFKDEDILKKELTKKEINKIRETYSLPSGELFICPNQFIKRKNNLELIEVFKDFKDKNLLLIGNGPEKEKYQNYIKDNNIKNIFTYDSIKREDLFNIYKVSKATITLSKEDIFGHTILEGMACGIPAISSNKVISAKAVIKNGFNGYLVDNDNIEEIKKAILSIDTIQFQNCLKTAKENSIDLSGKIISMVLNK